MVLAGGAAHGAYSVGVMEALFQGRWQRGRHGRTEATVFSGTSVGAFNGAVMAQGSPEPCCETVKWLRHLWVDRIAGIPGKRPNGVFRLRNNLAGQLTGTGSWTDFWEKSARDARWLAFRWLHRGLSLGLSEDSGLRRMLRLGDLGDFISTEPLERLIDHTIDPARLLHPAANTLRISTTQWDLGEAVIFHNKPALSPNWAPFADYKRLALSESNMKPALRASAALPGLFPKVHIEQQNFVDGGLLFNTPLAPAIESGARVIHVVTSQHRLTPIHRGRSPSLFETLERLTLAVPTALVEWDIARTRRVNEIGASLRELLPRLSAHDRERLSPQLQTYAPTTQDRHSSLFPASNVGRCPHLARLQAEKRYCPHRARIPRCRGTRLSCQRLCCLTGKRTRFGRFSGRPWGRSPVARPAQ